MWGVSRSRGGYSGGSQCPEGVARLRGCTDAWMRGCVVVRESLLYYGELIVM